jgi:hypothetical protein
VDIAFTILESFTRMDHIEYCMPTRAAASTYVMAGSLVILQNYLSQIHEEEADSARAQQHSGWHQTSRRGWKLLSPYSSPLQEWTRLSIREHQSSGHYELDGWRPCDLAGLFEPVP